MADTFGGSDANSTRQPDGTITDNASGKVVGKWYSDGSMDLGGKHFPPHMGMGGGMSKGGFGAGPMGAPGQPNQARGEAAPGRRRCGGAIRIFRTQYRWPRAIPTSTRSCDAPSP
jgi:hypothetical protein